MVDDFHLSLEDIALEYAQLPPGATPTFYHYTDRAGLEGILRSGGLRATYRLLMSDSGELDYALELFYGVLEELDKDPLIHSLTKYIRLNLERFRHDTIYDWNSYCACMTLSPDHHGQWKNYGDDGKGFSLGFNIPLILNQQYQLASEGRRYLGMLPIIYEKEKQRALVGGLIEAGISDLQRFMATCSDDSSALTALRNRITSEIFFRLHIFKDFMKHPGYSSENEMRFIWTNPNEKRVPKEEVRHFQRGKDKVPYLLFNLRSPITNRLPLKEIRIGPNASFSKELEFVEALLDKLGYRMDMYQQDRPPIRPSSLPGW